MKTELKCLILNMVPYGPQDDNGIGKNCIINYIPLSVPPKDTNKSKGYFISYNLLYENTEKCLFQKIPVDKMLSPCTIVLEPIISDTGKVTKKIVDVKFN